MLPTSQSTDDPKEAARQHTNFIILRSLEDKISPEAFAAVASQMTQSCEFPKRLDWTGLKRDLSFEELKVNYAHIDQNYLPDLLESNFTGHNKQKYSKLKLNDGQQKTQLTNSALALNRSQNLLLRGRNLGFSNEFESSKRMWQDQAVQNFERMKTVFGHAMIEEGYHAPIYNVKFDQTDQFIISGADDGIVKIWDRHSLNLQASLHSHEDVITDLDISKCNRYLATASKDGKIIVWDWKNCQKLDEFNDHRSNVNNVKFFSLVTKVSMDKSEDNIDHVIEEIQILVSCSEDGTIRVYDEIAHLEGLNNQNLSDQQPHAQSARRSSRQKQEPQQSKRERLSIILQPDDYRTGARNKKIYSVHVSKNGLVAAGTDKGDILLWELDIKSFRRSNAHKNILNLAKFLGGYKSYSKAVHFCEFSPSGYQLFSGSDDGIAKIWKIDKGGKLPPTLSEDKLLATLQEKMKHSKQDHETAFSGIDGKIITLAQHKEKKSRWECDSLAWSVNGRYAIAALSGKYDEDQNQVYCLLKVWDSFTEETINDLAKGTGLQNSTFVLAPHPQIEEILMTGSDGGTICMWNIKTRKMIKKFLEYGIYSYEKFTMNDPQCGRFSNDASCFVVGSATGTLSLFANDNSNFKYAATRVEQFYPLDDVKHNSNIYYEHADGQEPQICGYSMIPYECQPPSSQIGKFKNSREMTSEEYERNLVLRTEICKEEEDFIQGQLDEGLQNNMFNPQSLEQPQVDDNEEIVQRRMQVNREIVASQDNISNEQPNNLPARRAVNNQARRGRRANAANANQVRGGEVNNQQVIPRANLRMLNPNFDPDNSLYDRASDENFEDQEMSESSSDEDEVSAQVAESSDDLRNTRGSRQRRPVNIIEDTVEHQRQRSVRSTRRNHEEVKTSRRRNISDESPSLEQKDDTYDMSDINDGPKTRGNRGKETRTKTNRLPSSDDDSIDSEFFSDEDAPAGRRSNRLRSRQKKSKSKNREQKESKTRRNLRNREQNVNYRVDDTHSVNDNSESEEDSKVNNDSSEEVKVATRNNSKKKRTVLEDSQDVDMEQEQQDANYLQVPKRQMRGDEDYELLPNNQLQEDMIAEQLSCTLCKRSDGIIIGPFVKRNEPADIQTMIYFHQDCLEANNTAFYCQQKSKWLNVGKTLEKFKKRPSMCDRCGNVGAMIKCTDCRNTYHGHYCSSLYMIYIDQQQYQCFQCRNKINFKNFRTQAGLDKVDIKTIKRTTKRDHLLTSKPSSEIYIPQIGDEVYYFFQGHEKFISKYNCFFYCGDREEISFSYPWLKYPCLMKPTKCRVVDLETRYPSNNALFLLKRYGTASDPVQVPQIITSVSLEILDESCMFVVDIFPSPLPEFLVSSNIYEDSYQTYLQIIENNAFVGNLFSKRGSQSEKYRVLKIQNHEDCVNSDTQWLTLQCQKEEVRRFRANVRRATRRDDENEQPPIIDISFWDLDLLNDNQIKLNGQPLSSSAEVAIINGISEVIGKKSSESALFMERVTEQLARDYKDHICSEMYFTLITERLANHYYRSVDQVIYDLDLIVSNSAIYNSDEHEITQTAKRLVDQIKRQIRGQLHLMANSNQSHGDDSKKHFINTSSASVNDQQQSNSVKITINNSSPLAQAQAPSATSSKRSRGRPRQKNIDSDDVDMDSESPRHEKQRKTVIYQEEVKLASDIGLRNEFAPDSSNCSKNGRRSTRQNARSNIAMSSDPQIDSSTKITIQLGNRKRAQPLEDDEEPLLGKTTRSGRNVKSNRKNLRENSDDDSDLEQQLENSKEAEGFTSSKKRLRQL